jgi:thioredoxin reductase (NADPH)
MAKPVILIVDDEPQVLNAVERDLRQHYRGDYSILKAGSGAEALKTVAHLKRRATPLALFLVDQRMPAMTGTEFLAEARQLYPDARKVLLTAYADTEAAITSINTIGLDHYLMKPWDPPEQFLYPVLDDLLDEWNANVRLPYDGIRVAGTLWSATSHRVKDFLARNRIPYQWLDIERDAQARTLVETIHPPRRRESAPDSGALPHDQHLLPVVFFPDGSVLVQPDDQALVDKLGLRRQATQTFYDMIIVGAGPAGLAAAVYGASEGLRTIMIEKAATGGQAGTSSRIENYLGFPQGVSGAELARRATDQARRLGAEILTEQAVSAVRVEDPYRIVTLSDGTELSCHVLLIATGVSFRIFDVPGAAALTSAGIYYGAAMTEAANYAGQHVFVLGGANSAGQGAMLFSRYARKVTMLVRGESLQASMSRYLIDQIATRENLEVLVQTEIVEVKGGDRLEALVIRNKQSGEAQELPAAALFVFIGASAHTDWLGGVVERDSAGFLITGQDLRDVASLGEGRRPRGWALDRDPFHLETSVPGILAAGDVRHGSVKRVATAVGEGAMAVQLTHQYLRTV